MVGVSNSEEKCSQDKTHFENPTKNDLISTKNLRKPRLRQVSSRYLSPSPSPSICSSSTTTTTTTTTSSSANSVKKRYPSPLICHSVNNDSSTPTLGKASPGLVAVNRSQSADRRRPSSSSRVSTPGLELRQGNVGHNTNVGEVLGVSSSSTSSAASKMLFTSTRSLSVSFQGETFSLPISKAKVSNANVNVNASSVRKGTPERRRDTPLRGKIDGHGGVNNVENSKPVDQRRWPGKTREGNVLTKSFDRSVDRKKIIGSDVISSVRTSLQQSLLDESSKRGSFDGRLSFDLGDNAEMLKHSPIDKSRRESLDGRLGFDSDFFKADQHIPDGILPSLVPFDRTASDTDSVSSDSTSGKQECGGRGGMISGRQSESRGLISTRFWQETNSRLRRLQDPGSPLSTSPRSSNFSSLKSLQSKRFSCDSPLSLSSSPRTNPSPTRGAMRPASPSRPLTPSVSSSPSRGYISPSRRSSSSDVVSILSFSADIRRGKIGENRVVDAHLLRLLYNRYLQWRFVNARAEASFLMQKRSAEKNQWNAWITISELRRSVTIKRSKLLLLKQKLKLSSILNGQMMCLEEWALLDREHSSFVLSATEALKASTLRLPIIGKAVADIQRLKDAMGSAVDVMQAMGSSILSLLSKVEQVNTLLSELVNVTAKEQTSLYQCKKALCTTTAMQVKDCSSRTHILQLNRVPNTGKFTTLV